MKLSLKWLLICKIVNLNPPPPHTHTHKHWVTYDMIHTTYYKPTALSEAAWDQPLAACYIYNGSREKHIYASERVFRLGRHAKCARNSLEHVHWAPVCWPSLPWADGVYLQWVRHHTSSMLCAIITSSMLIVCTLILFHFPHRLLSLPCNGNGS